MPWTRSAAARRRPDGVSHLPRSQLWIAAIARRRSTEKPTVNTGSGRSVVAGRSTTDGESQ
jgi:hypothetical protein